MAWSAPGHLALRLTLARAVAWTLLLAGWVGFGSLALVLAPSLFAAFALVGLWLLALGLAATLATRDHLPGGWRRFGLLACATITVAALLAATRGGGLAALGLALVGWAVVASLASGVVRGLRLAQPSRPAPPIAAASAGALLAALMLGDPANLQALGWRLGVGVMAAAALLAGLQVDRVDAARAGRCRAGLFDCSLPAWPAGAWHDLRQWPVLLAGLVMLPLMAELPLLVVWCRAQSVPASATVLVHLAAMFVPALAQRGTLGRWSPRGLAAVVTVCLAVGGLALVLAPPPWNLLGLAAAHGAAWGLAWVGQLWAPDRRGRQGASPWRAAVGYAALTVAFGVVVERFGASGVTATHVAFGVAAVLAWGLGAMVRPAAEAPPSASSADPAHPVH
jgi:hypothetical protein